MGNARCWLEIISGATIPITLCLIIGRAWHRNRDLHPLTIQLTALAIIVPLILILALEKILDAATLGTLIGGIIGYAIAVKRESSEKDETD
jgi:hypothetical protein